MQCRPEKPILSLRSCCLYESDAALFAEYAWLNDTCIAFYFEVLQAKADVIFRRVVVAEGCTTHSGECSRVFCGTDGTQEEQNEEQSKEQRGRQHQNSEGGEGSRALSAGSFHGGEDEEIGQQRYLFPSLSSSAESERGKKEGNPKEKDVCCSFNWDNKNYGDKERGILEREKRWFSHFTEEMLQRNDKKWCHILSSLLLVKSNHQTDPSDIARIATQCAGESSKSGNYRHIPSFQTYEDRYTPVLFVDPCIAFWLAFSNDDDEVTAVLQGLHLEKRQVVLWPISDKQNLNAPGGTHWTLLVQVVQEGTKRDGAETFSGIETDAKAFSAETRVNLQTKLPCKEHTFFHLNSLSSRALSCASVAAAEQLQHRILAHFQLSQQDRRHTKSTMERVKCVCPQQNSSDCGIYCLIYAEKILLHVVDWWANNDHCRLECMEGVNVLEQQVCASDVPKKGSHRPFSLNFREIQRVQPAEALAERDTIASLIDMLRYG